MNESNAKNHTNFVSNKPLRLEIRLAWSLKCSINRLFGSCMHMPKFLYMKMNIATAIDSSSYLLAYSSNTHFLWHTRWNK